MNFQTFRHTFQSYPIISRIEIEKVFPGFDYKNLAYWQKKAYLQKIRNAWYRLNEKPLDSSTLFFISNQIYQPSYVSLETAMSYYGFIPEGVFKMTAVSTLKTNEFTTAIGHFGYQNLKSNLFFGYTMIPFGDFRFKMATPEKTILDFLYLHPEMTDESHFEEMRLNVREINQSVNQATFHQYCQAFDSKALSSRVDVFLRFIEQQEQQHI
jgi:predicted transcriptional regulator of viral defense system